MPEAYLRRFVSTLNARECKDVSRSASSVSRLRLPFTVYRFALVRGDRRAIRADFVIDGTRNEKRETRNARRETFLAKDDPLHA